MALETAVLPSPIGPISLEAEGGTVTAVRLGAPAPLRPPKGPALEEAARQISEYFAGRRSTFSVPIRRPPGATDFQHRVWDALLAIPPGETRTYGELARVLGTSPRAVGGACARNALPLLIPCHRVVARSGLGGFSGEWGTGLALDTKKALLELEAARSTSRARS